MRDESRVIGIGPEDVERAAAMHLRCNIVAVGHLMPDRRNAEAALLV